MAKQTVKSIYTRIRTNKNERAVIAKMFKSEFEDHPRYQEIVEEMKALRAEKKGIENHAYSLASKDAEKLDLLTLDIKSDSELLSDVALRLYAEGDTVEVIDEYNTRLVPEFKVNMVKEEV